MFVDLTKLGADSIEGTSDAYQFYPEYQRLEIIPKESEVYQLKLNINHIEALVIKEYKYEKRIVIALNSRAGISLIFCTPECKCDNTAEIKFKEALAKLEGNYVN